jgi:uncharacterized protein YjbI with pentapeptide repeats
MKSQILATAALLTTFGITTTANAANPEHIRQLLQTKQCPNCDLSGAGLVMANLSGANLKGANLTGVNLSRANLSGADLRNANLTSAGLFGVNLSGAQLGGANLAGADLRETYLFNADVTGAILNGTNLQGAVGIPSQLAKPEDLYALGVGAAQKGNQQQAIEYFNQAITIQPDYAGAYLARGVAKYQLFNSAGAIQDAQIAEKLFTNQKNAEGMQTAQALIKEIQTPRTAKVSPGKPNFMDFVSGLASLLLQFLPF